MKKLLLITQHFPPVNIVGALRPYRMVKHLCRNGWHVSVVANKPKATNSRDFELFEELPDQADIYFLPNTVPFKRKDIHSLSTWISKSNDNGRYNILGNPIVRRIIGTSQELASTIAFPDIDVLKVPSLKIKLAKIISGIEPDVILTTSPPHSIHLAGLMLQKGNRRKWIVDFRDPWDYYPQKGHYDLMNPAERYWEKQVIKNADVVISSSKTYSSILAERHKGQNPDTFVTITNTYNSENVPLDSERDPDRFVISYTGIFYPEKDPFTFFRALHSWFNASETQDKDFYSKKIKIQLIGSGSSKIRKIIKDLKLDDTVIFIDRVPHIEAVRLSANSDMLLMATGIGGKTRPGWTPSKLYEYLGCRVPILAVTKEGELAEIIKKTNSGYVVTNEDHNKISQILEKEIKAKFGNRGKNYENFTFGGIEKYEESRVMKNFVEIVEKLHEIN
jgi:glycosyltransferase involved in cell wall biosynthesis